ncbi:hypothetical protein TTHERM_00600590 (macronuclear) [Tetrahymena thermophila SB210]|uniref:Uncharacterized protein n=1 Tax=Tetrahymena thermophila (strain SB210) TaxID=312017 RepID=I7MCS9_TETTS|nr:hypothetical protein TTHERM_00600590 [Tetrahymena thermophila SB210]EAR84867.2 hypothetical protein TTHERM_00600590 [Tetrahymena thermophila SB210]|eukprot:XP_001032530.2 hypothetical protein TTHERM_00600590 [Tetrahymena thermophila SB210]
MNELDNQINLVNNLSYIRNFQEYDSDGGLQKGRIKRKTLMDNIQNRFYHNIEKIRLAVDEINNQRMLMQNKDQTPILTPVFQSVQTLIGKQRVKEAKMYTGKEAVSLDSQLFDIPLMDEEVKQYQKVFDMKKNNHDLLKFNKIENQIKAINKKLKDRENPVSLKLNENNEDQPEIFKQKNGSHKKKQSKQESIENRIQFQQKQLTSELLKKQFFQQRIKLQNKKKQHFIECDQRIKALYFQNLDEDETSECNSPVLQNSKSLTKSIFLKNNQSNKSLSIDVSQKRRSIDQNEGLNPSNVGYPSPIKKKLSSIYFPNESISKNSMEKSQSNYSQNLLSPQRLKSHTQSNQNSIQTSNQKIEQISRAQSFIYPYKLSDIKEKVQRTEKMNLKDEKQLISDSIQVMLDSIMEEKQKKKQRQSIVFQNKLQSQNDEQQLLSSSSSENIYFKENLSHSKTQNLSNDNKKFRKIELSQTNNIFLSRSNASNQNYQDLDEELIIKMEKNKIRGERLIQLKKKLGLLDQNTLKNEQIDQIVKEIDNIHKEQEEQNLNKLKSQNLKQIQNNNQQRKNLLTFSKNENYQLLKKYANQKRRGFQNQNLSEGRFSQLQNSSINQRVNKSMLINENFSIQDGEQNSIDGTLLLTNRSNFDKILLQNKQAQSLKQNEIQRYNRNENSINSSSFHETSVGSRQNKNSIQDVNYDNYKIQYISFQNQNQRKYHTDQVNQTSQESFRNKLNQNKFSEHNSLNHTQNNRVFNIKISKNQSQTINKYNNESSQERLLDDENRGGLNLLKNLSKIEPKKLSEKTQSNISLKTYEGISQSDNYGFLKDIQQKQKIEQNRDNNKQFPQLRTRLQNNSLNKRVDQQQQQESNPILVQSFLINQTNSLLDQSNTQHKLYQQNNFMKHFFRQKVNLKKEFGEKVTEADRETFTCKAKVSNFFDNLLDYQEQSILNSKNINHQINKSIKTFSSHLIGWKNELQECNQDNNNHNNNNNNHIQFNTQKYNKNISVTATEKLQEKQTKNLLKL